jgi:hypothetical protein
MNDDCLWRDATRLYKDRPVAPIKKQILGMATTFILIRLILKGFQKFGIKPPYREIRQRNVFEQAMAADNVAPHEMQTAMCFDKPSMISDVSQELLFRLLAMKYLIIEAGINVHVANVIQSLIFGFFHMTNIVTQGKSRDSAIYQSFASLIVFFLIGYLFLYTNSIFPCIIIHILHNQSLCLQAVSDYAGFLEQSELYNIYKRFSIGM